MSLLITPSLYSAYYWFANKEFGTTEDFLKVLRREPTEPNEAMQAGIDFENRVRKICDTHEQGESCAHQIADIVRGGNWQCKGSYRLPEYLLYGRADVIKRDRVYDIKYVNSYDIGKYQYSIQHWVYMVCFGLLHCDYLISNGEDVWVESYDTPSIEYAIDNYIMPAISDMVAFINAMPSFREAFEENWQADAFSEKKITNRG